MTIVHLCVIQKKFSETVQVLFIHQKSLQIWVDLRLGSVGTPMAPQPIPGLGAFDEDDVSRICGFSGWPSSVATYRQQPHGGRGRIRDLTVWTLGCAGRAALFAEHTISHASLHFSLSVINASYFQLRNFPDGILRRVFQANVYR